jgi:hypothetical protein
MCSETLPQITWMKRVHWSLLSFSAAISTHFPAISLVDALTVGVCVV